MCGIVGIIKNSKVEMQSILVDMLKKLEYRGYDSAGLACVVDNKFLLKKERGEIQNLCKIISNEHSNLGIAHTRWATHGEPSRQNAHPFVSQTGEWAIVHNGIIENYTNIKSKYKNYPFVSKTDSEIIACMLQNGKGKNIFNLIDCCNTLRGSFALLVSNKFDSDHLFVAKRNNPIYILRTKIEIIVASDVACFSGKVGEFYQLKDDEFCVVGLDKIEFFDKNKNIIEKSFELKQFNDNSSSKDGYKHFMQKEILEEGKVIKNLINCYSNAKDTYFRFLSKKFIQNINKIVFIGCGTAYHAGLMGAEFIKRIAKIDASAFVASEYRYGVNIYDKHTLFVLVSQSGETADTLAVCKMLRKRGCKVVGLTNVMHSSLKNCTKYCLPICAGPEIAVASTKAYIAQLLVLYMLAHHINNTKTNKNFDYLKRINQLSKFFNSSFCNIEDLSNIVSSHEQVFFMGRGLDYITCLESSLKLKEVSYISSSAYPAGEMKHGFLALVDEKTLIFVLSSDKKLFEKTLSGANEVVARKGKVVLISPFKTEQKFFGKIHLPLVDNELSSCILARYLQMLTYFVSVKKGINPDKPRNLAKSVTVE